MLAKEFSVTGANITITDKNIEKAIEIAEILDEKTVLIIEFDDKNEFAEKVLQNCNDKRENSCNEPFVSAFLYSK